MKDHYKMSYESPTTMIIEVSMEGVITSSPVGNEFNGFGGEEEI